jgi:hypothetical protein
VDAGVLANSLGTAREFESEITLRWKSLKTQAILCGWVSGTISATVQMGLRHPKGDETHQRDDFRPWFIRAAA